MGVWGWYGAAVMRLIGASLSFCDEGAGNSIGHGASSIDHGVRSNSSKPPASHRKRPVSTIVKPIDVISIGTAQPHAGPTGPGCGANGG
jgi:hypothetical protein